MSSVTRRSRARPESSPPGQPEIRPHPAVVAGVPERRRIPRGRGPLVWQGTATATVNHGSTFLVASPDGGIRSENGEEQGLYADDTRFLSGYEMRLNGRTLDTLSYALLSHRHARWQLATGQVQGVAGRVEGAHVDVTLDRVMGARRMHEDITVRSFSNQPLALLLDITLVTDFADLFEVRTGRWQQRGGITSDWTPPNRLHTRYVRDDFVRRLMVRPSPSSGTPAYANGALRFPVDLPPRGEWRVCIQYDLLTSAGAWPRHAGCPITTPVADAAERLRHRWHRTVARITAADPRLQHAYDQSVEDFAALRLYDHDFSPEVWVPAAGLPWFVAVFGRDSLIASLQALPVHPLFAVGTLQKLASWQSTVDDPVRDAEPGKICHEMRVGEWAHFGTVPHSPYYGTADATPLYLILLGQAYRWLGDLELLHSFRGAAERCLEWIDRHGDCDGDGLQEYCPRTPSGYRNHCWRDAEDGVLDENGHFPPHPIGTCEMQAYVYRAKLDAADLFGAWDDGARAERLRREAEELRQRFLRAYWMPDVEDLAFALDGEKRPLRTATSNPGHCLAMGILDTERAAAVADRLLRPDLFSGWGLRTLSSAHPAYDPHSYQRGSVWPHDTMLAAAGLRRHGRLHDAWRLIDALLAASSSLPRHQLPELFAGLQREPRDAPVPYARANVPQAWAAGVAFHAVRVLLGLEPDVPAGVVYVDPALPPWCPVLEMENVRIGAQRLRIHAERRGDGACDVDVEWSGTGGLRVVQGRPPWHGAA